MLEQHHGLRSVLANGVGDEVTNEIIKSGRMLLGLGKGFPELREELRGISFFRTAGALPSPGPMLQVQDIVDAVGAFEKGECIRKGGHC